MTRSPRSGPNYPSDPVIQVEGCLSGVYTEGSRGCHPLPLPTSNLLYVGVETGNDLSSVMGLTKVV